MRGDLFKSPFHKFIRRNRFRRHSCWVIFLPLSSRSITCNTTPSFLWMARLASLDSVLPLQQISNSRVAY